ncbi:ATP-dependent DNA helicase UvrD/PcrA [uncultured Gammaproteobacteria bacterium]|nr:ATP-dependent DNA helicase UvrD/PcrA (EC 3.6.4.12) [uncultured Gammaproteobacteria bacterium]VVH65272.1 ATP-dependent DNA helicase UvrD/PcrA [uncultured Gammaproteobacteria bacterium]
MSKQIMLSKTQQSIVAALDGALYVKASAGSGKTRVLTERIRVLLSRSNKKVLALTFTNKAGQEIKDRLADIEEIDQRAFVGTFHGFCQSVLENHGHLIGYAEMPHIFEDEGDRLALIEQAIQLTPSYAASYSQQNKKDQGSFRYRALNFIADVKRQLINEADIAKRTEDENLILLYRGYQDILKSQNAIDFDDLLLKVYGLFIDYPKIAALYRRSFSAICVDEAQDMNNAQYQLLKALANGEFNHILMVGDPNQSIFHFNGSSPNYMDKAFVKDFDPRTIELNENYRSSIAVLQAAQQLIPDASQIEHTVKQGVFELYKVKNETSEAQWVVNKIQKIASLKNHGDIEGELNSEKIVVLARNKYLFKSLEEALQAANIPHYYKMTPGALKFESSLMQIFDLSLRVKLNIQDELHKKRLLDALSLTDEYADLSGIVTSIHNDNQKAVINLVILLSDNGSNIKSQLEAFKNQISIADDDEKNMLFRDIDELLIHWHNYAKTTDNKSLHQFKNAMALGQTHPLAQHSGVTLSTVHTMKGQEFDIVFIIGMDDETFPDYRAVRSGGVELTQEKNNLYVAFTRSKRWLYVTWPENRTMPWGDSKRREISRFLVNFSCDEIKDDT